MATITPRRRQDGGVSYRAEVRLKGFPHESATFRRKRKARDWAADTESALRERRYFKYAQAQRRSVSELIDRYINEVLPLKPKARNQVQQLRWFRTDLESLLLIDLNPLVIHQSRQRLSREVIDRQTGRVRSPATINRYMAAISHACSVAVTEWGWLEESPFIGVQRLKEPRGRVRFLSDDRIENGRVIPGERTQLLAACQSVRSPSLYPMVVLALSTGMRWNELRRLRWADADLGRRCLMLAETKNGDMRVVPLIKSAVQILTEWRAVQSSSNSIELVFPGSNPNTPIDVTAAWRRAVGIAGLSDFRFHDLRHTTGAYLAMSGATDAEIARVLGHKSVAMTRRYSHFADSHIHSVLNMMEERYLP